MEKLKIDRLILTCEHGGNEVPDDYKALFRNHKSLLQSHRGWDPGALDLASALAEELNAPLYFSTTTRLLVDLNRSLHNRTLFSAIARPLPDEEKQTILKEHYFPYRHAVEKALARFISKSLLVLHLSVHTFTPVLQNERRKTDVGILYDPSQQAEKKLAWVWQKALSKMRPDIRIRRNYPYRGIADGFVTYLRKRFPADRYLGIELEVNQKYPLHNARGWEDIRKLIARSLYRTCEL